MKKEKLPYIVVFLILTLITSIAWISFNVYRSLTAKPPEVVPKEVSDPITPTLDQGIISRIESGIYFSPSEVPQLAAASKTTAPKPTPIIFAQPTASPSAVPSASPSASPSAI